MVDHVNLRRAIRDEGGGVLQIKMHVKDNDKIPALERALSDEQHIVSDYGTSVDPKRPTHPWVLTQRIETSRHRLIELEEAEKRSSSPGDSKSTATKKDAPASPEKAKE